MTTMKNFSTRTRRGWSYLLLISAVLVLGACSMIRVAYNNGESLGYWWLDNYVDFSPEQGPWVKARIHSLFDWHRRTQITDYIALLQEGQKQLQQSPDKAKLLSDMHEMRKRSTLILEQAVPDMADLALSLRPQQITNIEKEFASGNKEYTKKYLRGNLEHQQQSRFKKVLEQAEFWFGDFSREQEKAIHVLADAAPSNNERYYQARLQRQQDIVALLKKIQTERPSRDQTIRLLRDFTVAQVDYPGGQEFHSFIDAYNDGLAGLSAAVIMLTTPAQKAHANMKLQQFIEDFRVLSIQR